MKKLFIICGISFAGKSTLGKAMAERFNYTEVDVDNVKIQLYGPDIQDEDLHHEDWVRTYTETDHLIERYLQAGKTVIDASRNFRKEERQLARQIATTLNAEVVTIFVDTPEAVARQRLLENRKKPSRRDVSDEGFEEILHTIELPAADENPLVFHDGDHIESWISSNISLLS
ncbi:MAG: ATP-binding protein [Ktedonobacteraceae bacterium]|nr:ATP-binding protein [Ktedonobacteraceae bacterium]